MILKRHTDRLYLMAGWLAVDCGILSCAWSVLGDSVVRGLRSVVWQHSMTVGYFLNNACSWHFRRIIFVLIERSSARELVKTFLQHETIALQHE